MENSNLKNMVVLRNLPSNIVEEAIIVLKENKKVKKFEKVEKNKSITGSDSTKKEKDYILKEAEMLVNNYISKVENTQSNNLKNKEKEKSKNLKVYAIIVTLIIIMQFVVTVCNVLK